MTDTIVYSQQYNDFYHHDPENLQFTYHNLMLPSQEPKRRLSFSTLLQKRPSLMGRKLSIFRPKKAQLKVMIPMTVEGNLERMDTSASNSTDGEDCPLTPTSSNASFYYNKPSSNDLETALTTPTTNSTPLMDYSGKGYSNFYIKLPNGNWMVRVRDGNRKIVGTYEIDGSMI
ncbi:hypothetical protein INT48_005990 [Thamnidium elegans]|uniref:Uncharacterized protein n=1 Tax=Thamnidium elegans TaxID=101142 RepID=A0A8H7SQ68_9FUNG|nr:hypothetical protein INT48_005990 [Thamnidium elegans]